MTIDRRTVWDGLLAGAEVLLAVAVVYSVALLLVTPILLVTRVIEFELDPVSSSPVGETELLRIVEERELANTVWVADDGHARLVLDGVLDPDLAIESVHAILEESGYRATEPRRTRHFLTTGIDVRLASRLPALLAIQSGVFLLAGLYLSSRRTGRPDPPRISPLLAVVAGITGGVATLVMSGLLGWVLDRIGLPVREQVWVEEIFGRPETLVAVAPWMVLVGPVAEEVFFRRYAFRLLSLRAGVAVGYLGSSLVFGAIHMNPSGLPVYVLIGLVFCWLYRKTGTLWTPIAAHVTLNALVVAIAVATAGGAE